MGSDGATTSSEERARSESGGSVREVLWVFTKLGLTSFGGPVAHLGYMKAELVDRRKWVCDRTYADLVALCQFLPGPASSQVGMSLGLRRAGLLGGLAAWIGFTLPSALLLTLFALGIVQFGGDRSSWLHGLEVVAVPVVALAIWGMARSLCPDAPRATIAVAAAIAAIAWRSPFSQIGILLVAAACGFALYRGATSEVSPSEPREPTRIRAWQGVLSLVVFFALLAGLPAASAATHLPGLDVFERFYRVGSLVFGGGHVVLPLLEHEVVEPGWTTSERFLAGYGAAQAIPGPLFSFSAYLGFILDTTPTRWAGAALALIAIFLPSYLIVVGALPFWARLRGSRIAQAALRGTNAGVVGLLVAAFYDPVWTVGVRSGTDFALGAAALVALAQWKLPPWLVVIATAVASAGLHAATHAAMR